MLWKAVMTGFEAIREKNHVGIKCACGHCVCTCDSEKIFIKCRKCKKVIGIVPFCEIEREPQAMPGLEMPDNEIMERYRNCEDRFEMPKILAELNDCPVDRIMQILARNGVDLDEIRKEKARKTEIAKRGWKTRSREKD